MSASTIRRELARIRRVMAERPALSSPALPDPVEWAQQVSGNALDPWQQDLLRDTAMRTLLLCARQVGKSYSTAVKDAYVAAHYPGTVLVLAQSLRQSSLMFATIEATLKDAAPKLGFT